MAFAKINQNLEYWQKQEKPLFDDLLWNLPEQKQGDLNIIGGNKNNFSGVVRAAEYASSFPFQQIRAILPDVLRSKLPSLPNFIFTESTPAGSFDRSPELRQAISSTPSIIFGDLSKNSATEIAITEAVAARTGTAPAIITRDAVDAICSDADKLLVQPNLFLIASMAQLQKLFRAVYYSRMIMLSQPLLPTIETLHKFTLSYPITIITYHQEQIIVASGGKIVTTPIVNTSYSPISLWNGKLAVNIAALNLFNPNRPLEATTAAILYGEQA